MNVEVDAKDMATIERRFNTVLKKIDHNGLRTLLWRDVQPIMRERTLARFDKQGDGASGKWKKLRPATVKFRRYYALRDALPIGGERPINVRTGELRRYVTETFDIDSGGEMAAQLTVPAKGRAGKWLDVKFRTSQKGYGHTPKRPVLALNRIDQRLVEKAADQWFTRIVRSIK